MGTERDVAESGGLYLSLVGGSIVLLGLMTSLGALIRATHNPRLPLYVSFLSNALNILFFKSSYFCSGYGDSWCCLGDNSVSFGRSCDFYGRN